MSLFGQFEKIAQAHPQKSAIISRDNLLTFANLLEMTELLEAALRQRIPAGKQTVAFISNRLEFILIMMLVASRNSYTLLLSDPKTLHNSGVDYDYFVTEFDIRDNDPNTSIKIDPLWFSSNKPPLSTAEHRIEGEAILCARTSGSTGQPMLYPVDEDTYLAGLEFSPEFHDIEPYDTRTYCSTTPNMRWSQNLAFRSLLRGGSVFFAPISETHLPHLLDTYKVNFMAITPAFAVKLLGVDNIGQYMRSVRKILLAGAFVSQKLVKQLAEVTSASIVVSFGSTENNTLTAFTYDPEKNHPNNYLGEIVDPDFEVAFFDPETRERIDGNEGLLGARHPRSSLATPYLNTKGDTRTNAFRDGFFLPGDIIRREGNALFHLGRSSNVVNISGNKFSVDILEQIIGKIPEIRDVSIFSERDTDDIEKLYLAYTAEKDLSLDYLNKVLKAEMRFAKIHKAKRFASLPLSPSSKIDRPKVKAAFFA